MVHVIYFSHYADDFLIYVPVNTLPEGVHSTEAPIRNEEILLQNYAQSLEYGYLEKALKSEEISFPLPIIHSNPDYASVSFLDYQPFCGFVETWSTSIFSRPHEKWQHYCVTKGQLPSDEALQSIKGIVLLGGGFSANDQYEWMINLKSLLRKVNENYPNIKLIGICLGAQIIADTFGGAVEKIPNRYILKYDTISTTQEFRERFMNIREEYKIAENHGENVVRIPEGCERWGYSENCPNEIFGIQGKWLCFQGHPNYVGKYPECYNVPWFVNKKTITKEEGDQIILDQNDYRSHTIEMLGLIKSFLRN
mmetsp:Transcript_29311/g.29048  ORF Transcript_29311/g.29048 Transcript_29311/m.29048 type:complete len:309 (-) Transcript_29311:47-973(-)